MRTHWRWSSPSTRRGLPWPASATRRSTSSTMARTWRSFGAEAMTNSSATTRTSPTSRITTSRTPLASAAWAAAMASSRAVARSLWSVRVVLPPDQVPSILAQDHGDVDLVVGRRHLVRTGRDLLDVVDVRARPEPAGQPFPVGARVGDGRVRHVEARGVADDDDLGAGRHEGPGAVGGQAGVVGAVEQP